MQSNLTISDIHISNMYGTTSSARDPNIGTIVCSSPDVCSNIYVENIDVVSPSGTNDFICTNVSLPYSSLAWVCRRGSVVADEWYRSTRVSCRLTVPLARLGYGERILEGVVYGRYLDII